MLKKNAFVHCRIKGNRALNSVHVIRFNPGQQNENLRIHRNVSASSLGRLSHFINNRCVANVIVAHDGWTACISPPQAVKDA